jgi:8-oxo-dGTP pyrophosphatase MutT (NUDIX family)
MSATVKLYVSMLMFSRDRAKVAVLTKNRPVFLAGKICPVGGGIEENETPEEAAAREFFEETGVRTSPADWKRYAMVASEERLVHCFVCFSDAVVECVTTTDEPVAVEEVSDLLSTVATKPELGCPDLIALIGLALHAGSYNSEALIRLTE